ncbi:MAG: FKBP-type peptidyl-prolyl cis-trans isomerase [Prevotellaceae bacterium]|jgi:FKBP-type peptidyl-prolyl cis-trans isomerase SlyD|nr:FKBP-type peptidyl-prolyl cis-trans isomerase [Prevotellaceae bacterium]
MKIEQNKMVSLSYKLVADGDEIEVVTNEKPMQFIYGIGRLLPKFEEQIANMSTGDKFDFILQAADAYGEIDEQAVIKINKNLFRVDGGYDERFFGIGKVIPMSDSEGNNLLGRVEEIGDTMVTVNLNHPLAGNDLHFTGEIVAIREATPEELSEDYHCGCDCCDDDCCDDDCCMDDGFCRCY